jgi:hypothetical protein
VVSCRYYFAALLAGHLPWLPGGSRPVVLWRGPDLFVWRRSENLAPRYGLGGAVPVAVARCYPGTSFVVRSAGTGVPAQAAAAATHGTFFAGDTDTTTSVPAGP